MKIRIAARLHPFSHTPGTVCMLPKTHLKVRLFPARVEFFGVDGSISWNVEGPVKNFTIELDLEQHRITVFGMTRSGYMRYYISARDEGIVIVVDKAPGLASHVIPYAFLERAPLAPIERLSLGIHKLQDWDQIRRRLDFREIFPIWMRFGQLTPSVPLPSSDKGALKLLKKCSQLIEKNDKLEIIPAFTQLFLAGSEGMCVPRLLDSDYQGIIPVEGADPNDPSPLAILTGGAALIRSLFFEEEGDEIALLPCLPPDFHCGRMVDVVTQHGDRLHMEWSKKQMHSLIIEPQTTRRIRLKLSRHLRSCRVRTGLKDRGAQMHMDEGVVLLDLSPDCQLFLDRFQK